MMVNIETHQTQSMHGYDIEMASCPKLFNTTISNYELLRIQPTHYL